MFAGIPIIKNSNAGSYNPIKKEWEWYMENKTIGLAGPLSSHSGYGEYARSIAMSLLLLY